MGPTTACSNITDLISEGKKKTRRLQSRRTQRLQRLILLILSVHVSQNEEKNAFTNMDASASR